MKDAVEPGWLQVEFSLLELVDSETGEKEIILYPVGPSGDAIEETMGEAYSALAVRIGELAEGWPRELLDKERAEALAAAVRGEMGGVDLDDAELDIDSIFLVAPGVTDEARQH